MKHEAIDSNFWASSVDFFPIKTGRLTCIVFNTNPLNTIFRTRQRSQTGYQPAITQKSLLDISGRYLLFPR
jgi:hypothetical protein